MGPGGQAAEHPDAGGAPPLSRAGRGAGASDHDRRRRASHHSRAQPLTEHRTRRAGPEGPARCSFVILAPRTPCGGEMAARLTLPRTAAWVWYGEPRSIFGLDAVFVRCASGTSGAARSGFSYAENFRAWLRARGPSVIPWSWFGPPHGADGGACADALAAIAPGQRVYVVEIGPHTPPEQVAAFAARLRQREPIAAIGFSTWPTRAEAEQAAVPWDVCVDAFDFGLPQVCTPAQRELLVREDSPVVEDMAGKPIHVATFPDADPNWVDSARRAGPRRARDPHPGAVRRAR